MGLTTPYSLPYADPTDQVKDGAVAMQLLAEAIRDQLARIDEHLTRRWATGSAAAATGLTDAVAATVTYDVVDLGSGHFTEAGGVYTYTGAEARFFMVSAGALLHANGSAVVSRLSVLQNAAAQAHSRVSTPGYYQHSHHLAVVVNLQPGDTVAVEVLQNVDTGASDVSEKYLRMGSL